MRARAYAITVKSDCGASIELVCHADDSWQALAYAREQFPRAKEVAIAEIDATAEQM